MSERRDWTPKEDDQILEALLGCDRDMAQVKGTCDRLAAAMGRGGQLLPGGAVNGDLVWRRAWGLAIRYEGTKYTGPVGPRVRRRGPPTFCEQALLLGFLNSQSKGAVHGAGEVAYLAELLQRPPGWVDTWLTKLQPKRNIAGFDAPLGRV
jgi:hypothetical protein